MNDLINLYIMNGFSLFSHGEKAVVLPLKEALLSLKYFKGLNLVILGGDIYSREPAGNFEHTYDNWSYEGISSQESVDKAESYLNSINNINSYVSFVFKQ